MGTKEGGIIKERTNIRNTSDTRWIRFGDQLKVGEKRGKTIDKDLSIDKETKISKFRRTGRWWNH